MLPYTFERVAISELRLAGYTNAQITPGQHIQPVPNLPITMTDARITVPEGIEQMPYNARILNELRTIHKLANEATWLFDNTPVSRARGVDGQKQFAKYMNTLLVARLPDSGDPQYFVQTREYDGSFTVNRRTSSFADAKVHFLVLSSIIQHLPAFEPQNMQHMYRSLIYRGLHDTEMQNSESTLVQRAIEAIEQTFPGLGADRNKVIREHESEVEL